MKPYYESDGIVIWNADCRDILPMLEPVDLVLTSPPYDNLRDYGDKGFDYVSSIEKIVPVVKEGGICIWVVGDSVIDGSESGNSFRQALFFMSQGMKLHDTMIYQKDVMPFPEQTRYNQCFEYMFVFSKGKPITFNAIKEKTQGYKPSKSSTTRNKNGEVSSLKYEQGKDTRNLFNVWKFLCGYNKTTKDAYAFDHPAMFPEKLAANHIISWSNPKDTVLDCFMGSGTTLKMAKQLGRKCIGIEIEEKYCEIAAKRLAQSVFDFG